MLTSTIIRAWKNKQFRESLSSSEAAQLPEHPAGLIDLTDAELGEVAGGDNYSPLSTYGTNCSWGWRCL
ncbi:MAG TPA: mersacidin/lichenicidin family type 2 lantibiotic [Steroidobacteraceae bacterium]|nr:mersacidin/lichenicidin family type 2 lantibiotic [Steroidobacteraceae bacterium]